MAQNEKLEMDISHLETPGKKKGWPKGRPRGKIQGTPSKPGSALLDILLICDELDKAPCAQVPRLVDRIRLIVEYASKKD